MNETEKTGFAERLKSAADAKKALLEKFKAKPHVTAPPSASRATLREDKLAAVRAERATAKAASVQARAEAQAAAEQAEADLANAALDAKRGERKERKALSKTEAKAKRDARYAARKSRQ